MRTTLLMIVALLCGLCAFVLNMVYLAAKSGSTEYVGVKQPVSVGEKLTPDILQPIEIQEDITTTAVPYAEAATLFGRIASRNFLENELVLWQDITAESTAMDLGPDEKGLHIAVESLRIEPGLLRVGVPIGFVVPKGALGGESTDPAQDQLEQIGPFRVVGVNSKIVESPYAAGDESAGTRLATITVATRLLPDGRSFSPDATRLILANKENAIFGITFAGKTLGSSTSGSTDGPSS